jgi:hypothetical protein
MVIPGRIKCVIYMAPSVGPVPAAMNSVWDSPHYKKGFLSDPRDFRPLSIEYFLNLYERCSYLYTQSIVMEEEKQEDDVFGVVSIVSTPVARQLTKGRASTCPAKTERLS